MKVYGKNQMKTLYDIWNFQISTLIFVLIFDLLSWLGLGLVFYVEYLIWR